MIYLSCHRLVDGDGNPCILASDAEPRNSRTWLKLETVFDMICTVDKFSESKKDDDGVIDAEFEETT